VASAAPVLAVVVCVAAASLLVTDALRFDATGWLRWGREIALGQGAFDTTNLPSWKPLPTLLTVPLAFTGAAAPALWLLGVRVAGLTAIVLVGGLTARRTTLLGGATAAAVLTIAPAWWPTTLGGGIEPVVVVLGCGAVIAHQARRPVATLLLLAAMALGREEAFVLLIAYAVLLVRQDPRRWSATCVALVLVVVASWLGGDFLGSGRLLHGGELAQQAPEVAAGRLPEGVVLLGLVVAPLAGALWLAGVVAALTRADRLLQTLVIVSLGWVACDLVLGAAGLPVPARFLLPAAAAAAVVAGAGAASLGQRLRRSGTSQTQPAPWPSR
jgi:hypothetical protein